MPRKLTAKKLLAKFPKLEHKAGFLTDLACPKCGNADRTVKIDCKVICKLDEHETQPDGDYEWDGKSYCECRECHHYATVKDFTFKGLDDLIAEAQDSQQPEGVCDDGSIAK